MHKRQLDRPIVWQVQAAPLGIVELCRCKCELSGFGEVALVFAKTEVPRRVGGIPLKELPIEVKQEMLARSDGRRGIRSWHAGFFRERPVYA